jgi:hypothetical protein
MLSGSILIVKTITMVGTHFQRNTRTGKWPFGFTPQSNFRSHRTRIHRTPALPERKNYTGGCAADQQLKRIRLRMGECSFPADLPPTQLALEIRKRGNFLLSREHILKKLDFLAELDLLSSNAAGAVFQAIIHSLFAFARDINPPVRLKALLILSTTAITPAPLIEAALSKGEHETQSMADCPHIGAFGICLEDAVPEVRAMAIRAIGAAVVRADDQSALNVMTAITQMINDSSTAVRAASITALSSLSRMVNHLITLEDQQLRLVLPVLSASDSSDSDRQEVISFLSRLKTSTRDQTIRVMEELPKGLRSYPNDREYLVATACAFGRNNASFMGLCAAPICRTLSSIRNLTPLLSSGESLIQMLAVASACLTTPFVLVGDVGRDIRLLMPVIIQWENANRARPAPAIRSFVNLDALREKLEQGTEAALDVVASDETLADACDLVAGKAPPEAFRVDPGQDDTCVVTRYVGVITSPKKNSRYTASVYSPGENFFFEIIGQVTPRLSNGLTIVVGIETPVLTKPFYFQSPVDGNGRFRLKKSIVFPECTPFLKVKLSVFVELSEGGIYTISEPVDYWFVPSNPPPI